ncbi:MAG: DJ-1/PfpI family protein [Spirochaetaceae bacterium]|nr:DJ-1/PfpI family protein [Spirochaetaceae bacterium]
MLKVAVLLADGFEEVEAVTPADFLRRAGLEVHLISANNVREVAGNHHITFVADLFLNEIKANNYVAVIAPGGMPSAANLAGNPKVISFIEEVAANGGYVAAICAAPAVVLSKTNLLKDKKFTSFPNRAFKELMLPFGTYLEERVVVDGKLITSRGPGTAAEFSCTLIGLLLNDEAKVKELFAASLYNF